MTANETAARPQRRVGTFTLGVVLVAAGLGMLASLFWPALEIGWLLKASPLILVALGVETLLSARGGGRIKYDWLGMLLCFLLVGAGLVFYAAAWAWENQEYFNGRDCTRYADESTYRMEYDYLDGFDSHTLHLKKGEALECRVNTYNGWLEVEISGEDGEALLEASSLEWPQTLVIPKTGEYTILVHGRRATGSFSFLAGSGLPEEALEPETPEEAAPEVPEAAVPEESEPPAAQDAPEVNEEAA